MLKHRLFFGILMSVLFIAVVIFDGWLDGSITALADDDKPIQGTVFCLLIALLAIPAQLELSKLALGWFTSSALVGCILGALMAGQCMTMGISSALFVMSGSLRRVRKPIPGCLRSHRGYQHHSVSQCHS